MRFFFGVARSFPRRTAGAVESSWLATPTLLAFLPATSPVLSVGSAAPLPLALTETVSLAAEASFPLLGWLGLAIVAGREGGGA